MADSHGESVPARVRYGSCICSRRLFSRSASSASATLMVMTPSACPVSTGGAADSSGSARNSNARPCSGSSLLLSSGKLERGQRVDEPPLGDFELVPRRLVRGPGQVRDNPRQPARATQGMRIVQRYRPVADIVSRIVLTQLIGPAGSPRDRRSPQSHARCRFARPFEGANHSQVRKVGDGVAALDAIHVFEKQQLPAVVAVEGFHKASPLRAASGAEHRPRRKSGDEARHPSRASAAREQRKEQKALFVPKQGARWGRKLRLRFHLLQLGEHPHQDVRVHRLDQVVVEPRLLGPPPVLLLAPAGQGDRTIAMPHGCSRMRRHAS